MIARLTGRVLDRRPDGAVVDVGGVGYRVSLSLRSLSRLPAVGETVALRTQTVVRTDAFDLYGFVTEAEEEMFLHLTSVQHVGPRGALNILSGMEPSELAASIATGDVERLQRLPGVGKKTAERLCVELKDKVKGFAVAVPSARPATGPRRTELVSALLGMGYRPAQAERAAERAVERAGPDAPLDALVLEALRAVR